MFSSYKNKQLGFAALLSIPLLVLLAWPGLKLPFDFQPDPNYSHVLNGLHLADTGRYDNTFYPGVLNFYVMALFNVLSGVTLPSSAAFGIAAVEKATYVARAGQLTITAATIWAWAYALSTWLPARPASHRERRAYSIAVFSAVFFMLFSYAFIYQAYFLRPDNALSLCIALGLALFSRIRNTVLNEGELRHSQLLLVGIWIFCMTATKSQGQVFIALGCAYLFWLAIRTTSRISTAPSATRIAYITLAMGIGGCLLVAAGSFQGFAAENRYAIVAIPLLFALVLLASVITNAVLAAAALYVVAGWCFCLILIYVLVLGQAQAALEIANPLHTLIVQAKYNNLELSLTPLFFHFKHLGIYGAAPLVICIVTAALFRKWSIFLLMGLGLVMVFIVSLRLPGYYNGILFLPFFCIAAGLGIHEYLTRRAGQVAYLLLALLVAGHIVTNVSLHASHMTAFQTACLSRGSLVGVRYDPDTINIRNTIRNEGWAEYAKHYFTVITDFDYWPEITNKLKGDKDFRALLDGSLTTCRLE